MRRLNVKINDIPESGLTLTDSFDPAGMDLQMESLRFEAPLKVAATFLKESAAVVVNVSVAGDMQLVCGRCLEKYECRYDGQYQLGYPIEDETFLDVTEDIRQEILLDYPMNPVCKEECRGLCPRCGKNLNEGACSCPPTGRK